MKKVGDSTRWSCRESTRCVSETVYGREVPRQGSVEHHTRTRAPWLASSWAKNYSRVGLLVSQGDVSAQSQQSRICFGQRQERLTLGYSQTPDGPILMWNFSSPTNKRFIVDFHNSGGNLWRLWKSVCPPPCPFAPILEMAVYLYCLISPYNQPWQINCPPPNTRC